MGREELIAKVKDAEADIKKKIDSVTKGKDDKIECARKKARAIEEEALSRSRVESEQMIAAVKQELEKERTTAIKVGRMVADKMKGSANTGRAKEIFIKKFNDYISA